MKAIVDKSTGNLVITISKKEGKELKARLKEDDYIPIEDALDSIFANGYTSVLPHISGALTDSPIITDGVHSDDGESIEPSNANFWWYPQYELFDPVKELAKNLRLDLHLMVQNTECRPYLMSRQREIIK